MLVVYADSSEHALQAAGLSLAILSAGQGGYSQTQLLLDITQGARIATSAYPQPRPPQLTAVGAGTGAGARVSGWQSALRRAAHAPAELLPGLLADAVPGGAAYAGVAGEAHAGALLAADRRGRIAAFSLGSAASVADRTRALLARHSLTVAELPEGVAGAAALGALSGTRPPGELLVVIQRVHTGTGSALLWLGVAGLAAHGGAQALSSASTRQHGLVSAVDLAPSVLVHLGLRTPAPMDGHPLHADGALDAAALRSLIARLRVIDARRLPALAVLLCVWAALIALSAARPRALPLAARTGALALMWSPVAALASAALEPSPAASEFALIALLSLVLAAVTDALLAWPRAPAAPALAAVVLLAADALAGTQLELRSLLGPDPLLGARFYGIGNELKAVLAVLCLAAVAGVLHPRPRSVRAAGAFAAAGALLALIEGPARLGAGVGGVVLVCAGSALAAVLMLPGALTRRRILAAALAPLAGLAALAVLDIVTAHGSGHFNASVLHARSAGEVRDVLVRRYRAAWLELRNHLMPLATALALAAAVWGIARRRTLLRPVEGAPAWRAALAGGLCAGAVGALVEDSGPLLFVSAVLALACVAAYLWGRPVRLSAPAPQRGGAERERAGAAAGM